MTWALLVIGLILVGLPVLALGLDRVLPAPRARPLPYDRDPHEVVRKQFSLSWQDQIEVAEAVKAGRATRAELRPAVRRLAELILDPAHLVFRGRPVSDYPRWQRVTVAGLVAVLAGVYLGVTFAHGRPEIAVMYAAYLLLAPGAARLARRRRRQRASDAVAANPGPAEAGADLTRPEGTR